MQVRNVTRGNLVAERATQADSFFLRLRGLLGRSALEPGEGLWIDRCRMVHTFFMRFPIDAAFLDREGSVVRIFSDLKPWRVSGWVREAAGVLELAAGRAQALGVRTGDRLEFS